MRLRKVVSSGSVSGARTDICAATKLPYASEISRYDANDAPTHHQRSYETDLLVFDETPDGDWTPRVIVECKLGAVTTHDALTYSAKAATHKHVHPYLRYGILIGRFDDAVPGRLIRHGAHFDFMMVWLSDDESPDEWLDLERLLLDEVEASRTMQVLLSESRLRSRQRYRIIHRPLRLNAPGQIVRD